MCTRGGGGGRKAPFDSKVWMKRKARSAYVQKAPLRAYPRLSSIKRTGLSQLLLTLPPLVKEIPVHRRVNLITSLRFHKSLPIFTYTLGWRNCDECVLLVNTTQRPVLGNNINMSTRTLATTNTESLTPFSPEQLFGHGLLLALNTSMLIHFR